MLTFLLPFVLAPLIGAASGLTAAYWFFAHRSSRQIAPIDPPDPFVSAEIDQAAAQWAAKQERPEAAGVMADKLHMLYDLARRRRQS
jgi:hypothetical protein